MNCIIGVFITRVSKWHSALEHVWRFLIWVSYASLLCDCWPFCSVCRVLLQSCSAALEGPDRLSLGVKQSVQAQILDRPRLALLARFACFLHRRAQVEEDRVPTSHHPSLSLDHERGIPPNSIRKSFNNAEILRKPRQLRRAATHQPGYIVIILFLVRLLAVIRVPVIVIFLSLAGTRLPLPRQARKRKPLLERRYPLIQLKHLPPGLNPPSHLPQLPAQPLDLLPARPHFALDLVHGPPKPEHGDTHILNPLIAAAQLVAQRQEGGVVPVDELQQLGADGGAAVAELGFEVVEGLVPVREGGEVVCRVEAGGEEVGSGQGGGERERGVVVFVAGAGGDGGGGRGGEAEGGGLPCWGLDAEIGHGLVWFCPLARCFGG
ncbi:hypothetical protein CaCOL14_004710 [Colletotrichum acutatum]